MILLASAQEEADGDDELPHATDTGPVSQMGELWQIGRLLERGYLAQMQNHAWLRSPRSPYPYVALLKPFSLSIE